MTLRPLIFAACVALVAGPLPAAPDKRTEIPPEEQTQLQRDKMLITNRSYRQIFSPYIFSPMPVFITTDSLLNACHVLLEESFVALEERFCAALPDSLDRALAEIKDAPDGMEPDMFSKAARHARIVLGTAAKLSGGTWSGGGELEALIAEEVKRVEAAEGLLLPAWLPPDDEMLALDFAVFKPTGFYTQSERLKRYFRAVRWLQTIPFRVKREEEMAAMLLLVTALSPISWMASGIPCRAAKHLASRISEKCSRDCAMLRMGRGRAKSWKHSATLSGQHCAIAG